MQKLMSPHLRSCSHYCSRFVSDNPHSHRATRHLMRLVRCGREGVRSEVPAGFHCFLSENVAAGVCQLWQEADPDIPVLKQAMLEYAKLQ